MIQNLTLLDINMPQLMLIYDTIFADVGVMIIAVLNAIRCLFVKKL